MSELNSLIDDQLKIGNQVQDKYRNFKKDTSERKTLSYCQKRLSEIKDLSSFLDQNHAVILTKDISETHEYVKELYYDNVKEVIAKYREALEITLEQRLDEAETKRLADELAQQSLNEEFEPRATTSREAIAIATAAMTKFAKEIEGDQISAMPAAGSTNLIRTQQESILLLNRLIAATKAEPASNWSRVYVQHKLEVIEAHWKEIYSTHMYIMTLSCKREYQTDRFLQLSDSYHAIIIALKESLAAFPTQVSNELDIRLPKITLPVFDGSYLKWKPFQDLYTQIIHNRRMAASQKFFYLRANLSGEPHNLIKHLQATEANYITAWNLLTDRYDNPRLLITAQLHQLMSLPTLHTESAGGIKKMHDTSVESLQAIKNLGIATDSWDPIILHILVQKLDKETRRSYEQSLDAPRSIQSLTEFFKFLEYRFQTLESCPIREEKRKQSAFISGPKGNPSITSTCSVCKSSNHQMFQCKEFLKLSIEDRIRKVRLLQLCINCLKHGHSYKNCNSRSCMKCGKKHNTLLHLTRPSESVRETQHAPSEIMPSSLRATPNISSSQWQVLLATAIVNVRTSIGTFLPGRVLLDTGSQLHFISARFAHELELKRQETNTVIAGIGTSRTRSNYMCKVTIASTVNDFSATLDAMVLSKISEYQPNMSINISNWKLPEGIKLADPLFYKSNRIDMLLGADLCFELFEKGKLTLSQDLPLLQNTRLGWIVAGKSKIPAKQPVQFCNIATQSMPSFSQLEKQIKRFWESEHYEAPTKQMTQEEFLCEQHFSETVARDNNGTFIVRLPFKEDPSVLGSSRDLALKRLQSTERRLSRDAHLKSEYANFLNEYKAMKHMCLVKKENVPSGSYFLPHHCVFKPDSSSTKLRVVFDGSAKTTSGKSLNQILMVGSTVQSDLFAILIRFRTHQFVFTADICKMYRQILVSKEDRKYQSILWREDLNAEVQSYQMNTVTYGTSSAPFLATRCLRELAEIESVNYPSASRVIKDDMYVDDCLSGAETVNEAEKILQQTILLLKQGNFELRKFCANDAKILYKIPNERKEKLFTIQQNEAVKTLGLIWSPQEDVFHFNSIGGKSSIITKRTILSDLSKLFDPLGLIGPSIVLGKLLLQELWKTGIDWDTKLPSDLERRWCNLIIQFNDLNCFSIPRCTLLQKATTVELHSFSDSSEVAYGACFYLRSVDQFGQVKVSLLCSKSRIAPLKFTTIAKLELCAAVLMTEVVDRLLQIISKNIHAVYYYTDSSTVLA